MTSQKQDADANALAIQSGGDTNIHIGPKPEEVSSIIKAVFEAQLPMFKEIARQEVETRTNEFAAKLIEKFTSKDEASVEALKDPDFQYVLVQAHHAYARSGEPVIADALVNLIALRSKQEKRSRLSLTLNEAIGKTAVLTTDEFAALSLIYFLKNTVNTATNSLSIFVSDLKKYILPLLPDISRHHTAYTYLVAQNCATLVTIVSTDFYRLFKHRYTGLFSKGFSVEELNGKAPPEHLEKIREKLVIPCLNDPSKFQFNTRDKSGFMEEMNKLGIEREKSEPLWSFFERTIWDEEEFIKNIEKLFPEITTLKDIWEGTPIKSIELTPVGIAIGYANLTHKAGLQADLSIWIA